MKEIFLSKSISLIKEYKSYSKEEIDKILYGLEGLYLTISKLAVIFILSLILGIFKQILLVLLFFNIIRYPAFGAHANNSISCLLLSILLIVGLTLMFCNCNLYIIPKLIICSICILDFILFAPADTAKRPMTDAKKRKRRKVYSCLLAISYSIAIIIIEGNISNLILISLIIESIMINPISYKIMHITYNNYKRLD
ncbi:MAG: accessory gene regulator B family protein [bacterium]|nr:accessory gene regulator B family protein [bacterium]